MLIFDELLRGAERDVAARPTAWVYRSNLSHSGGICDVAGLNAFGALSTINGLHAIALLTPIRCLPDAV